MYGELAAILIVVYKMISKEIQREQILKSAREVVMADPHAKVKAQEVAQRANIARTSLYEHFRSMNELLGELLLSELSNFRSEVRNHLADTTELSDLIERWTNLNLSYFADGRHALVRALIPNALNSALKDEIRLQHIKLYEELKNPLERVGYQLSPFRFELITAVLEAAAKRIEGSSTPELVRLEAISFINKALA